MATSMTTAAIKKTATQIIFPLCHEALISKIQGGKGKEILTNKYNFQMWLESAYFLESWAGGGLIKYEFNEDLFM